MIRFLICTVALFLISPTCLWGQNETPDCKSYDRIINEAKAELSKGRDMNPDKVFNKLRSAKRKSLDCQNSDPSRNSFSDIDDLLRQLFAHLKRLKLEAQEARRTVSAQNEALNQKQIVLEREKAIADSLRQVAENQANRLEEQSVALKKEKALLEQAALQAEMLQQRSDQVLDMIYFYDGRYGLANNGDPEAPLYGFIDRDLNVLIDFKYQEALPFDDSGYARVLRNNDALLIDTTNQRFRLAESIPQLRSNTQALDLRRSMSRSGRREGMIGKKLPKKLNGFRGLEIILANNGSLTDISSLHSINKLKELQINHNELEDLEALTGLRQLRILKATDNEITKTSAIGSLKSLQTIDLSGNDIKTPEDFTGLESLMSLNLSRNKIKRLNIQLNLPALRQLNLSRNRLVDISGIFSLAQVEQLILAHNNLSSLVELQALPLRVLDLDHNKIKDITPLAQMPQLEVLNLANNAITDLAPLSALKSLRQLDISGTKVTTLDPLMELEQLSSLKLLKCRQLTEEAIAKFKTAQPNCTLILE